MRILEATGHRRAGGAPAGFTLIETIMAVALGSVMLAALYTCFGSGFSAIRTTREDLRATQIIVNRMERIRVCTWSQLTDPLYNPPLSTDYFDPVNKQTPYTVTYRAAVPAAGTLPEAYRADMRLVTVDVTWTSGGRQQKRSMQTYVARNGMQSYVSMGR
jgi:prepilin-type N-terminal cleavage/methylation domain-containing protein